MTDKVQLIREEIERQIEKGKVKCQQSQENNDYESFVAWSEHVATCGKLLVFINSLPEEPASEDLDTEIAIMWSKSCHLNKERDKRIATLTSIAFTEIARHFAEWQKQQDEKLFKADSWNYIEENYPNINQEEKLRLYDISIKSRLAGANAIKQQLKEAFQTEYEKGRFDMREEMMKDAVEGISCTYSNKSGTFLHIKQGIDTKDGDKVKIIIVKTK